MNPFTRDKYVTISWVYSWIPSTLVNLVVFALLSDVAPRSSCSADRAPVSAFARRVVLSCFEATVNFANSDLKRAYIHSERHYTHKEREERENVAVVTASHVRSYVRAACVPWWCLCVPRSLRGSTAAAAAASWTPYCVFADVGRGGQVFWKCGIVFPD